jgi:hypothetical protein
MLRDDQGEDRKRDCERRIRRHLRGFALWSFWGGMAGVDGIRIDRSARLYLVSCEPVPQPLARTMVLARFRGQLRNQLCLGLGDIWNRLAVLSAARH